jgi:hypothetical protein
MPLERTFNPAGAQPPSTVSSFTRCLAFAVNQPEHMDVDEILFRPTPGAVSVAGLFSVRNVAYAGSLQPGVLSVMALISIVTRATAFGRTQKKSARDRAAVLHS